MASTTQEIASMTVLTLSLVRVAIDLIQVASISPKEKANAVKGDDEKSEPPKETDSLLPISSGTREAPHLNLRFNLFVSVYAIIFLLPIVESFIHHQIQYLAVSLTLLEGFLFLRNPSRSRSPQRILQFSSLVLYLILVVRIKGVITIPVALLLTTLADIWWTQKDPLPERRRSLREAADKPQLSRKAITMLLKPYFWPSLEGDGWANRIRAIATWFCVLGSKACGLTSPLFLGWASTSLAHQDYRKAITFSIMYSVVSLLQSVLKEGQSLVYLKVAQAAYGELSEAAFRHLHSLSLDFHLRKKMGETLRSMDRGISACDTLMKYLFLWLLPALLECLVVCIIFAAYFQVRD